MSDDRIAVDVRNAFESAYEPNPGLEERVMAAIPWEAPKPRRQSWPRAAARLAGVLAVITITALVAPSVVGRLDGARSGHSGPAEVPAYSLGAVSGESVFLVQRMGGDNLLLQSSDGGRKWTSRVSFGGVYDGMQMFGQVGFIWSLDLGAAAKCQLSCRPSQHVDLFRTFSGGATWMELPAPNLPVNGVFFLDAQHGWIDSGSPATGIGPDILYATTDGGESWAVVGPLPQTAPMGWVYGVGQYHVTFSGSHRGWYLGDGVLYTTTDGGHTWNLFGGLHRLAGTTLNYYQPVFSGQDGIMPVAYRGAGPDNATANDVAFFVTHDGGASWSVQPITSPAGFAPVGDILSISILDTQHIWLTSQSLTGGDNVQVGPAVARTSDGGLTWTIAHHTPRILQMTFRDATHGFALDVTGTNDVNGILVTSDAGATWQRVSVPVFA